MYKILLMRGWDAFIFRGMDILGSELIQKGHSAITRAPASGFRDQAYYDIVIGNSQGAVEAMNRQQNFGDHPPKMIVTIDIPPHPNWRCHPDVKHLNIYGPRWGTIPGANNISMKDGHLALSFSPEMRRIVVSEISKLGK